MKQQYLIINTRDELFRLDITHLVFFEADGNYSSFTLGNGQKGVVSMNLSQTQQMLNVSLREHAQCFARIGKRYVINMNYVQHIEVQHGRLTMGDGMRFQYQLTVSKEALKNLKDIIVKSFENKSN